MIDWKYLLVMATFIFFFLVILFIINIEDYEGSHEIGNEGKEIAVSFGISAFITYLIFGLDF